ncbi:RHS repeat domain-containing protein [Pseudomonas sp. NPDC088368]|uniref:RHS repeat domain-containing protein n=1 Tax=Pseudomonas sp. NPDC088368 TaxID=3364453 RepID=UPI003807D71B
MDAFLHARTASITARDSRQLVVLTIRGARRERDVFDNAARVIERFDARRLFSRRSLYALSGTELSAECADAGWQLSLLGEAGQTVEQRDGRGLVRRVEHDALLRPIAVLESGIRVECYAYGAADEAAGNRCGRLTEQRDQAGRLVNEHYALGGQVLVQGREVVATEIAPTAMLRTHWAYGPLGDVQQQTDAGGHVRRFTASVSGEADTAQAMGRLMISSTCYDAEGRLQAQTLGNGVGTEREYDPPDGRLARLRSRCADGTVLQDLTYRYDPVGNPLRIEDAAQPVRHFNNQRVEPVRTFAYDIHYQLIEATGYEAADNQGIAIYSETYDYDLGGNMLQLVHVGAKNFTRTWQVCGSSNRAHLKDNPPDFDANGNLQQLQPGQSLQWDSHNRLSGVSPVQRDDGNDDYERYLYGADNLRACKTRHAKAGSHSLVEDVLYLPDLQIRNNSATGETWHVLDVCGVRVLHWVQGRPAELTNNQPRYLLTDHLGSTTLELDSETRLISQEIYYPYGSTAWSAARSAIEVKYRFVRYSGRERDATGLYDYGLRYYAPWLCRWINPDPAGEMDGLNRYRFASNSPVRYGDVLGAAPYDVLHEGEMHGANGVPFKFVARGRGEFSAAQNVAFEEALVLATTLLDDAIAGLSSSSLDKGTEASLEAAFGTLSNQQRKSVIKKLRGNYKQQRDYLQSLNGENGWKVSLYSGASAAGVTFGVRPYAPQKTMALREDHVMDAHPLEVADTLIHEASHASHNTRDVFYNKNIPFSGRNVSDEELSENARLVAGNLVKIAASGPILVNAHSLNREAFDDLAKRSKIVSVFSKRTPLERFIGDEKIRSKVLLSNADTYGRFVRSNPAAYATFKSLRANRAI